MPQNKPNSTPEQDLKIEVQVINNKVICDPDPARVRRNGTLQLVGDAPHEGEFTKDSPFVNIRKWSSHQVGGRHVSDVFQVIDVNKQTRFEYNVVVKDKNGKRIPVDPVVIIEL